MLLDATGIKSGERGDAHYVLTWLLAAEENELDIIFLVD